MAIDLLKWTQQVCQHWSKLRFGAMTLQSEGGQHLFQVQVYLDELDCDAIQVELYAEPLDGGEPVRQVMARGESLIGTENAYHYSAAVPATRSAGDFTPRIIPFNPAAFVPMESSQILWFR